MIIVLILVGIFFRFYNLERKVYWYDETMTSLRISGHTQSELVEQVFDGRTISVEELLHYQYPNRVKGLHDTLDALAGNPEHSPLYYLMARGWLQIFGNSVTTIRVLSALISLLVLPCIYWLCLELFGSSLVGWVATALIAISPFHILYAQEAREYSLWTVTILFSGAALLWTRGRKDWLSWGVYSVSVALGLYVHPFSGFVSVGHGIYILMSERCRWSQRVQAYFLSSFVGVLLFVPWLWIVIARFSDFLANTDSVNRTRSGFLPLFWGLNLSRIFIDFNQGTSPLSPLHYLCAALAGYALYYLCRHASPSTWVFVITSVGVTGIALIAPDIILGGRRSSITRYAIPCYLGIQIAVAYLLTMKLSLKRPSQQRQRWRGVAIALIFSGVLSAIVSSQIPVWWHKSYAKSRYNPPIARTFNSAIEPLVISNEIPGRVLSLAHLLNPQVHLQLVTASDTPTIDSNFKTVFLYRPSDTLLQALQKKHRFEKIQPWVWQLTDNDH
ncbi:MAG: glycosyltransferase family 39 protein [Cyanophyceae cyanobacterium]